MSGIWSVVKKKFFELFRSNYLLMNLNSVNYSSKFLFLEYLPHFVDSNLLIFYEIFLIFITLWHL
jgi:hypothetical protein